MNSLLSREGIIDANHIDRIIRFHNQRERSRIFRESEEKGVINKKNLVLVDKLYSISKRKNSLINQGHRSPSVGSSISHKEPQFETSQKQRQNLWQQRTKIIKETARELNQTQTQLLIKPTPSQTLTSKDKSGASSHVGNARTVQQPMPRNTSTNQL